MIYLITENILWITLKSWINCRTKITIWPVFSDFRQASFPPVFPKPRRNPPMDVPHRLVPGSRKRCALCYYYRVKTKSGWDIYTNYKCEACDVALCNREITQCFGRFHEGIKLHYNAQMIVNSVLGCEQDKRWNLSVGQFLWEKPIRRIVRTRTQNSLMSVYLCVLTWILLALLKSWLFWGFWKVQIFVQYLSFILYWY